MILRLCNNIFLIFLFIFSQLTSLTFAKAGYQVADKNWFLKFPNNLIQSYNKFEHYDLFIPAITWHARFIYDKEKINRYNEHPFGVGVGQARWDDRGNWHSLYLMVFKDSFKKWEPFGGYAWEKTWRPFADNNFHLGLGYTAGFTARDNWKYIPIPAILPIGSLGYGPISFQMTYIPGSYNNGNIYFAWMLFSFN